MTSVGASLMYCMKPRRSIVSSKFQPTQDILPPVPISTKLDNDDVKQQIMDLYPDLFSSVGTIRNAMVHLDVKLGAVPVICAPPHFPHAIQPKLKEELDRMLNLGVIRKLDINEASDWVHALVIIIKPNGKLCVCLDPGTFNSVLRHNVHNAKRFVDIMSKIKGFKYVSKIDADSDFWTLPLDLSSQLLTTFDTTWGRLFSQTAFWLMWVSILFPILHGLEFR